MTTLHPGRPLKRLTATLYRGRPLVLDLYAHGLTIYPLGHKSASYHIDYHTIYEAAGRLAARLPLAPAAPKRQASRTAPRSKPSTKVEGVGSK